MSGSEKRNFVSDQIGRFVLAWIILTVFASTTWGQASTEGDERRVKVLIAAVGDAHRPRDERIRACLQLELLGPKAEAAVPALLRAFQFREVAGPQAAQLHLYALSAIESIGPSAIRRATPILIQTLKDLPAERDAYVNAWPIPADVVPPPTPEDMELLAAIRADLLLKIWP